MLGVGAIKFLVGEFGGFIASPSLFADRDQGDRPAAADIKFLARLGEARQDARGSAPCTGLTAIGGVVGVEADEEPREGVPTAQELGDGKPM